MQWKLMVEFKIWYSGWTPKMSEGSNEADLLCQSQDKLGNLRTLVGLLA